MDALMVGDCCQCRKMENGELPVLEAKKGSKSYKSEGCCFRLHKT